MQSENQGTVMSGSGVSLEQRMRGFLGSPQNSTHGVLVVVLLPLLVNLPALLGWLSADPLHFVSGVPSLFGKQLLRGWPWIDPNVGYTAQALGKLAADEWLSGKIPWWNYYSGVGLPLAAEMQPGALLLPFVLLNHFANGTLYLKVVLQILAGLGTYFLLRKIELIPLAALAGAVIYEFNGVFGWHGPPIVSPVAFLPWIIFGIECAREKSLSASPRGWLTIALALALSIYAGFPETAYINGLLAGVWSFWRIFGASPQTRHRFIKKLLAGVVVGLLLSAPIIIPFIEYAGHSYLGGHSSDVGFNGAGLRPEAFPQIFFPWLYGSIWSYLDDAKVAFTVWCLVGGFLSAAQLAVIFFGLFTTRRYALYIMLLSWIFVCLGSTFNMPLVSTLVASVPLLKQTAVFRYSQPSWAFCSAVLCSLVVNDIVPALFHLRRRRIGAVLCSFLVALVSLSVGLKLMRDLYAHEEYRVFFWSSLIWGFGSMIIIAAVLSLGEDHYLTVRRAMAILLAIDAVALFSVPGFCGITNSYSLPAGIEYLKKHLGMQRFYTLGPVAPNYGAYYRIASINHNYLPVAQNWVNYLKERIDPWLDPVCFTGNFARNEANVPSQADVLRDKLPAYTEIGVRYVVTAHGENPFQAQFFHVRKPNENPPRVFESSDMDIYELPGTKPYFETVEGNCDLRVENRSTVWVKCVSNSKLIRRELFYPGWTAKIGGTRIEIEPYNDIFQAIKVPPGKYKITFTYTPTHWLVIVTLFLLGAVCVMIDLVRSLQAYGFRASSLYVSFPGLKAWAVLCSPFGRFCRCPRRCNSGKQIQILRDL